MNPAISVKTSRKMKKEKKTDVENAQKKRITKKKKNVLAFLYIAFGCLYPWEFLRLIAFLFVLHHHKGQIQTNFQCRESDWPGSFAQGRMDTRGREGNVSILGKQSWESDWRGSFAYGQTDGQEGNASMLGKCFI